MATIPKTFGALNLAFAAIGIFVELQSLRSTSHLANHEVTPFVLQAFYAMSAMNAVFMLALVLAGYRLLRYGATAIFICNLVFLAEIVYFVVTVIPWGFHGGLARSIVAADGIGNMAMDAQEVVGYPLFGLVVLSLYHLFSNRGTGTGGPAKTAAS